jgi:hypothetical protein
MLEPSAALHKVDGYMGRSRNWWGFSYQRTMVQYVDVFTFVVLVIQERDRCEIDFD